MSTQCVHYAYTLHLQQALPSPSLFAIMTQRAGLSCSTRITTWQGFLCLGYPGPSLYSLVAGGSPCLGIRHGLLCTLVTKQVLLHPATLTDQRNTDPLQCWWKPSTMDASFLSFCGKETLLNRQAFSSEDPQYHRCDAFESLVFCTASHLFPYITGFDFFYCPNSSKLQI